MQWLWLLLFLGWFISKIRGIGQWVVAVIVGVCVGLGVNSLFHSVAFARWFNNLVNLVK